MTNSRKELTEPTKQALIEIQEEGKKVVLASGRPINGIVPLAEKLNLSKYGGYMLSFNGARITQCSTGEIVYNRTLPADVIAPIYEITSTYPGLDILTYDGDQIPVSYTHLDVYKRQVQWGFKAILKVTGVHTTVIGFENIPDEPVLFIGNHRSFFDILLTY